MGNQLLSYLAASCAITCSTCSAIAALYYLSLAAAAICALSSFLRIVAACA